MASLPDKSGIKDKKSLPDKLLQLVASFNKKFKEDSACYNWLYICLKDAGLLNTHQCSCEYSNTNSKYKRHPKVDGVSKKERDFYAKLFVPTWRDARVINGKRVNINPRFDVKRVIPYRLPERVFLPYFAECRICNKRYYITYGTVFHKNKLSIKELLLLFMVAEYANFSMSESEVIMLAFRYLAAEGFVKIENIKTLYSYRGKFTNSEQLCEFQSYKLIPFLSAI